MIKTLKGIPRTDHAAMLETLGVKAGKGGGGADSSTMTANIQAPPTPQNVERNILEYIDREKSTVFFMLTT